LRFGEIIMSLITELDIVNACLKSMGEAPINSTSSGSPIVQAALESLYRAHQQEQAIGWYFNTESVSLNANTDQQYQAPADTLSLSTDANPPWLSLRGSRLYDNRNATWYTGTKPIVVRLVRLISLPELSYNAASLIMASAVLDFQDSFDADELKINKAKEAYQKAYTILNAEHIRSVGANMLYQGANGSKINRTRRFTGGIDGRWS
jgi:hypothetical protein